MTQTQPKVAPPSIMVIFGAGGDLTKRKLIPAICNLKKQGLLPAQFAIVAVLHSAVSSAEFRGYLKKELAEIWDDFDPEEWDMLAQHIYTSCLDFEDIEGYERLKSLLTEIDSGQNTQGNYLFYLATPPRFFGQIATCLNEVGLSYEANTEQWRRLIIEKPFGHDLASAKTLNCVLHANFEEHQIYRIDHYLGKETVQNILAYRFANSTVEPIWNHKYIDHVQITVAESVGVENRASYYDHSGCMRDMIPNHLLAVLSVIAMEPPNSFDANALRDEQTKVLRAIQPLSPEDVLKQTVRGQYAPGNIAGKSVEGYRDEPGIAPESKTETFVAMKLMIDSWRWAGVPFYIRTGKRMPGRYTEVVVQYKHAPSAMFHESTHTLRQKGLPANMLVIRIQPNEGIEMVFNAKEPGPSMHLGSVTMDFQYKDYFGSDPTTGYETLIYDCMSGDATLFKRADNIEVGWEIVEQILDVWGALPTRDFPNYAAGEGGPAAADELLERDGRQWKDCGIVCET
ncbi:MAG: glucose-6-phosphate dehydrogenase [Gammaproteobacteria bacterium]|nr:glucose-6-phosphate dehydrogenase [Gammaproteobacteria bacterium]